METKTFVNGFESWAETHHEIALEIERLTQNENSCPLGLLNLYEEKGIGGMYLFAIKLTDEFETLYEGVEWEGGTENDYFETLENFLSMKFNS